MIIYVTSSKPLNNKEDVLTLHYDNTFGGDWDRSYCLGSFGNKNYFEIDSQLYNKNPILYLNGSRLVPIVDYGIDPYPDEKIIQALKY